ncbi:hypothetical protein [Infirmifilum sp. SLHALR2]|nr:MAG: hypothetical protein B7L53_07900 [Thermofilum sp. NZ13]
MRGKSVKGATATLLAILEVVSLVLGILSAAGVLRAAPSGAQAVAALVSPYAKPIDGCPRFPRKTRNN